MPKQRTSEERNRVRQESLERYSDKELSLIKEWRPRLARDPGATERTMAEAIGIHHTTFSERMGYFGVFTPEQIKKGEKFLQERGV